MGEVPLSRSKSLFASESRKFGIYEPPTFEHALVDAVKKMCCEFKVLVSREFQSTTRGPVTASLMQINREPSDDVPIPQQIRKYSLGSEWVLCVKVVYDYFNRACEISLHQQRLVPRQLLQLIGIISPCYTQLIKMSLRDCRLNKYTIHEMAKILDVSKITDLCFDGSSLSEGNYAMLLDSSNLKVLSLSRCNINDIVCEQIAAKLDYFAKNSLLLLNLSMNLISDQGVKAIAWALRSNRTLRSLNLAGNQVTDDGALCLLNSLMIFPLTYDECVGKRTRYMEFHKYMMKATQNFIADGDKASQKYHQKIKMVSSSAAPEKMALAKADMLASEAIGPFADPFGARATVLRNGYRYCAGNMSLSHLNLAYNSLEYPSLQKLEAVVKYQQSRREPMQVGLIKLVIDGNNLPLDSTEYHVILEILQNYIQNRPKKKDDKRKSKVTIARGRKSVDAPR